MVDEPFPPYLVLSPSRSSAASWIPVEAPLGTAARKRPAHGEEDQLELRRCSRGIPLTLLGDDVDLDGGVATTVPDLASVNEGDGHFERRLDGGLGLGEGESRGGVGFGLGEFRE